MNLRRIVHAIVLAWGWPRRMIAFGAGAISVLALSPFDLWPVMFFTVPVAIWIIDGSGAGRWSGIPAAAAAGWWFGFGYFLAGFYWIGNAFLVDAKIFGWLMPFAVTALPAGMAIYMALGFALARAMWTRGALRIFVFAAALTAAEWLRGHLFGGFPWNAFGYALTGPLVLAQAASLVGLYGLTFISLAVFSSPATLADEDTSARRRLWPLAASLALLAVLAGYGALRLSRIPIAFVDGVRLRIMQPNIPQDERFNYSAKQSVLTKYLALSDRATGPQNSGMREVTHLIWPESAFPFFLMREADALAQITSILQPRSILITGAVREAEPGARNIQAYNSVYALSHDGNVLAVYDKVHLVPFGEYLPLRGVLEKLGLNQLVKVPGGFIAGDRHRVYGVPGAPAMAPLVCYEIIFPGEVIPAGERPGWMLNVTNDAWFGISTGPYQHLQQARVRAIEEGLPLVRAANSGISAVIDPLGRTIRSLPLGTEGVVDASLPRQIDPPFASRIGDAAAAMFIGVVLLALLRRRIRG